MSEATTKTQKTTKVGMVASSGADKSVVVKVENFIMHPLYRRFVRTTSKFMAHDEENTCNPGDRVVIEECRPISKRKIIERAQ